MGQSCPDTVSEEVNEMLDLADERACQSCRDWEEYAKEAPAIEKALHDSMVRCLEENLGSARENIGRGITQKGDEAWPTQQQLDEMVKAGKEQGVSETEIICTPLICGTGGVIDMGGKIRDVMYALHTSPLPPQFRDDKVFSKIVFVNRQEMGKTGLKDAEFNPETKILRIFKNADGVFPNREALKGSIFPHETFHANRDDFLERLEKHQQEWVLVGLLEKQFPSKYVEQLGKLYNSKKISFGEYNEELAAEWYRRHANGECSKTTADFFDKYFSD